MSSNYESELSFAKQLAAEAKKISDCYYKTNVAVKTKSDASPVTIADETINAMVIERIKEAYPDHGVLGEEQTWQLDRSTLWVCDPIDGTVSFTIGVPEFAFAIALVVDGVVMMAVAMDLSSGDMFWAVKDGGSSYNGKRIQVSSRPLHEAWFVFPSSISRLHTYQHLYAAISDEVYHAHLMHGSVFKGMLIAQGLIDGVVYADSISAWDMAAVKLLVEEAGGKVTALDGSEPRFDQALSQGAIVSSSAIHDDIIRLATENL